MAHGVLWDVPGSASRTDARCPFPSCACRARGFSPPDLLSASPVKVHVSRRRLVIEAAESERVPQAEVLGVFSALVADEGLSERDFDDLQRRLRRLGPSD